MNFVNTMTKPNRFVNTTIVTVASLATMTLAVILWTTIRSRQRRQELHDTERKIVKGEDGGESWMLSFEQAAMKMKTHEFASRLNLTTNDKLMLYGLYKQVIVGDAPDTMPSIKSWNIMEEKAKYNVWYQMKGLSKEKAALHYVAAVEHFASMLDWEKNDSDDESEDDSDSGDNDDGGMGPSAISRPIDDMIPHDENDTYDDAVHVDGTTSYESQLLKAASANNVDAIHKLLQSSATSTSILDVNHPDPSGSTALHIAADKGCLEALQVLVQEYNANVNSSDHDGVSVLQTAVIAGHFNICEWLLNHTDANPDQTDVDGESPRSCAQEDDKIKALFEKIPYNNIEANLPVSSERVAGVDELEVLRRLSFIGVVSDDGS